MWAFLLVGLLSVCQLSAQSAERKSGYETHRLANNILVSVPPLARQQACPVILVFGGSHYATPQYMWEQTPGDYFDRAIMVYSACFVEGGLGLSMVLNRLNYFLKDQGLEAKHISVCGFSSGGSDALLADPGKFKCVGLIDPVPETKGGPLRPAPNTLLSFRRSNWATSDNYGQHTQYRHFEELARAVRQAGGIVEEPEIEHKIYPKYFFERFRKELLSP